MNILIPDFCLVLVIGQHTSSARTFARRHFSAHEFIEPDGAAGHVTGNANEDGRACDPFERLLALAERRLRQRSLVAIDATDMDEEARTQCAKLARRQHAASIVLLLCAADARLDGQGQAAIIRSLDRQGFHDVRKLSTTASIDAADVIRQPLAADRRHEVGPFDIIGDVHGCADELIALMTELGYRVGLEGPDHDRRVEVTTPARRRAIFVGDLVDRGPRSPDVLRIAIGMVGRGQALAVPGNHDAKFLRWLSGRNVKPTHGLDLTIAQMDGQPVDFRAEVKAFFEGLANHLWLDGGKLVVAHAGIKEEMIGRSSGGVREFCLYGDTAGEIDELGLPIRYHWAADYRGTPAIVYGHTPVPAVAWFNNTLCIDTGCSFGGSLTALRWPEGDIVSVPAQRAYAQRRRPFGHPPVRPPSKAAQQATG